MLIPKTYFSEKIATSNQTNKLSVLVFKTSVEFEKDVKFLAPILDHALPDTRWNFDLDDCDRIFRVESPVQNADQIIDLFTNHGFICIELE